MNSDRLNQWLALGANIATLVGGLMVLLQLQQNRELTRAQVRHDMAAGIVELLDSPAGNSELASILRRGSLGEELTPDEQYRFQLRTNALFRYWEDVHYQYRQGLFDESEFSTQRDAWRSSLASSVGAVAYWCSVRRMYSPAFASEMDSLLPAGNCRSPDHPTGHPGA